MLMFAFYKKRSELIELLKCLLMLINGTLDITDEKEKLYIEKYNNYINGDESLMDN